MVPKFFVYLIMYSYPFPVQNPHPTLEFYGIETKDESPHIRLSAQEWLRIGDFHFSDKEVLTNYVVFSIETLFQAFWNQILFYVENSHFKYTSYNDFNRGWIPMVSHVSLVLKTAYFLRSDKTTFDLIVDEVNEYLRGNRAQHPFSAQKRFSEMGRLIDHGCTIEQYGGIEVFNNDIQYYNKEIHKSFYAGLSQEDWKAGAMNADKLFTQFLNDDMRHYGPTFENLLFHFKEDITSYIAMDSLNPFPKIAIINESD